jgi:hypothetical protein
MSGLFDTPDWTALGLALLIVGCFLLANGILLRDPRTAVAHRFGGRTLPLRSIRELVFHRVQMALGFAFAIAGFALQLFGRVQASEPTGPGGPGGPGGSTGLWIGLVVLGVVVLEVCGWWWSLVSTRRTVRAWLLAHPGDLERDPALTREVGELFGIASHGDDTLPSYVARLRRALDLRPPARVPERREPQLAGEESD